jgi:hypothetical protein
MLSLGGRDAAKRHPGCGTKEKGPEPMDPEA